MKRINSLSAQAACLLYALRHIPIYPGCRFACSSLLKGFPVSVFRSLGDFFCTRTPSPSCTWHIAA